MEYSRFPNRLKVYRMGVCLSQKQVAKVLGLPNTSKLSRWEHGYGYPSIEHLFYLCLLYKTIPQSIYTDLWQNISKDFFIRENNLLAQHEPFTI
ncbi:helix-turn-helix transcriptional regulator [Emticicia sp. BO119]|uniref:helix-turn-helix transcriptional regulator n=1 Tax=Emticicia sp. BO119 TaxID=2757768 RepID=UPI0015F11EF1|nr:helix-turn-helix transcriptional regulator [Emticicia sp. BO119]MBA4850481.1 helix-turn-helix transcriptional regulator [Emticicia sp. BO119]